MIIILHGENSFLSQRKLNEIIAQYRAKHKTGLSFFVFEAGFDFLDFKSAVETVSMFSEKKLIVLKDVLADAVAVLDYLKEKKIKDDADTVAVFYESAALDGKDDRIKWLLEKPAMVQESKNLDGAKLCAWIKNEATRQGGEITNDAADMLISFCGNDMWRLSNEIGKLVAFAPRITKENVVLLARQNIEADVFGAVAYLVGGNAKAAVEQFWRVTQTGEDPIKTFGLVVFQFRTLLKVRSALDEPAGQTAPDRLAKNLRLHPFVLRKTLPLAKKYTAERLRRIYKYLLETDMALKRGEVSFEEFMENLSLNLGGFLGQRAGDS